MAELIAVPYGGTPTGDDIGPRIVCEVCGFTVPLVPLGKVAITNHVRNEHPFLMAALREAAAAGAFEEPT